jgi:1-acyl-sn-glycerol-3-phosphate acyltransferase
MTLFWRFILKAIGWRTIGSLPQKEKKYVIIVAPHTSNWDFIMGVIIRGSMGFKSNFLGKDTLFKKPFGIIFKRLGGIPVDRKASQNMVEQVVAEANKRASFILAIAPEGTRGKVKEWRTGFYYIALNAKIPIVMCQMDYGHKEARFLDPFYPTGNSEVDLKYIKSRFLEVKGLVDKGKIK